MREVMLTNLGNTTGGVLTFLGIFNNSRELREVNVDLDILLFIDEQYASSPRILSDSLSKELLKR